MIELRGTNRVTFRKRIGIEFPVRVRIVKRTSKAILAIPLRKRRHGAYVPRLWIPLWCFPGPVDEDVVTATMPMWLWEENARPEPSAVADAAGEPS